MNNIRKPAFYSFIIVMGIVMVLPASSLIQVQAVFEDDGEFVPDGEEQSNEEQEQQEEEYDERNLPTYDEDTGKYNDDDDNGIDDDSKANDDDDLPVCEYKVVKDCVVNEIGQKCLVGTDQDACQDIFYGYNGELKPGEKTFKPLPYCDKVDTSKDCYDRRDIDQSTGLYPCNEGTQKKDYKDCEDATKSKSSNGGSGGGTSSPSSSSFNPNGVCYNEEVQGCVIPACSSGVLQRCVIEDIGLICNPEELTHDSDAPSVVGGGHACYNVYHGISSPTLKTCKDGTHARSCGSIGYSNNDNNNPSIAELTKCSDGTQKAHWRDCDYRADGSYPCSDGTYEVDLKACNIAARSKLNA